MADSWMMRRMLIIVSNKLEHFPQLVRRREYSTRHDGRYYVYTRYRDEISEDSQYRCVYCDCHIDDVGGLDMMQLDHFKPKSIFPDLMNDPNNLVLSCSRCNLLKHDDWIEPSELNDQVGYFDPFSCNRKDYYSIHEDGEIHHNNASAYYLIEKLALNRRFLKLNRIKRNAIVEAFESADMLRGYLKDKISNSNDAEFVEILSNVLHAFDNIMSRFEVAYDLNTDS